MFGRLSSHRKLALSFILMLSLPLTAMAAKSTSTPNIVLVVMDNFGYGEIGVYGGGFCVARQRLILTASRLKGFS